MSVYTTISPDKLSKLIGTANTPALIDVRTDEDFTADPRLIPGAIRRNHEAAADWGEEFSGRPAIVICLRGQKLAQGTAAWLRHLDVSAEAPVVFQMRMNAAHELEIRGLVNRPTQVRQIAVAFDIGSSKTPRARRAITQPVPRKRSSSTRTTAPPVSIRGQPP